MDRGSLYRLALSYLGVAAYVPGSPEEQAMRDVEQHCISLALTYTKWRWASRSATLTLQDSTAPLPGDCFEITSCSLPSWDTSGTTLIASAPADTAHITYTSSAWADSMTLPDKQPIFCEALALLLAAKSSVRITGNLSLAAELESRAYATLYRAKLAEVRAHRSNDQSPTT